MEGIKMIDLYIQGKKLGEGSFGVTYLCTEIATGQNYACKCIKKSTLVSQQLYEAVQREIGILRLINIRIQPNIVFLKDIFEDEYYIYIVMELCEGGTVHDYMIENDKAIDEPRAAKMMKEIIGAIAACHCLAVVHRDLKLENLLFKTNEKDSPLKVIDFGLANFIEYGDKSEDVVGSPCFIAPEVVEGHHGRKADIWSAGVILYILLAKSYPFYAETLEDTYKEVMVGSHDLFEEDPWPNISECAKDLIGKMLTRDVNKRLSASEVLMHPWIVENTKLKEIR